MEAEGGARGVCLLCDGPVGSAGDGLGGWRKGPEWGQERGVPISPLGARLRDGLYPRFLKSCRRRDVRGVPAATGSLRPRRWQRTSWRGRAFSQNSLGGRGGPRAPVGRPARRAEVGGEFRGHDRLRDIGAGLPDPTAARGAMPRAAGSGRGPPQEFDRSSATAA